MRATLAVVAERGYHDATLHEIVARAGSSKPTVYRRWPSKPRLVADAVRDALAAANPSLPAGDDPRRDLAAVVRNVIHALATTPLARVLAAVLGVAEREPALAAALLDVERERRRLLRRAVARVGARDPDLDVDVILGALYFRVLMRRRRVPPRFATELVRRLYPSGAGRGRRGAP
jgi:AcrR family transcriptional regulator